MLKFLGRLAFRFFNVEIRFHGNWRKDNKWLIDYGFNTIIDIGANEGQFALKMRRLFPAAKIISFEPIPMICEKLKENFRDDEHFEAYAYGLGDKEETSTFYLNNYSPSSSLLRMNDHKSHFTHATEATPITVNIKTLDEILKSKQLPKPLMVKIDVQGFEDKVITGGHEIIRMADVVLCEVSFIRLYQGQKLFKEIFEMLSDLGFSYHGNIEQLISPVNNEILQADAIFIKMKNSNG
jgi:FkbM family methyltransferase